MLRRHFMINTDSDSDIHNNEIWYTSSDGNIVTPATLSSLPNIVSNKYSGRKGVIKFETDVINIGKNAFNGCSSLTSVTIPNSVTSIGDDAFRSCDALTSITIPNSVTSIGIDAFAYCKSLTSITIPNGVTHISAFIFGYCSSLTSVTIPNSVTYIAQSAFWYCSSVTSVTIPNSVTYIGDHAFYGCTNLKYIDYEGTVEQWKVITKGTDWNRDVPATIVHCIDDDVEL